jgi:molybdopterin-guanine dinucleotide biosynthesis protein A
MNRSQKTEGFVLVGGNSRRMGTDKALLEIDGESLAARAVRTLRHVCGSVTLVFNADQAVDTDLPHIRDEFPGRGALGGLHAALKSSRARIAIVLAVDLPLVSTEAVANLVSIADSLPKFLAVVPRQADGRAQPLFAAYRPRFCLPHIEFAIAADPRASVRDFLDRIGPKFIDPSKLSADRNLLANVNTPEDFAKIVENPDSNHEPESQSDV